MSENIVKVEQEINKNFIRFNNERIPVIYTNKAIIDFKDKLEKIYKYLKPERKKNYSSFNNFENEVKKNNKNKRIYIYLYTIEKNENSSIRYVGQGSEDVNELNIYKRAKDLNGHIDYNIGDKNKIENRIKMLKDVIFITIPLEMKNVPSEIVYYYENFFITKYNTKQENGYGNLKNESVFFNKKGIEYLDNILIENNIITEDYIEGKTENETSENKYLAKEMTDYLRKNFVLKSINFKNDKNNNLTFKVLAFGNGKSGLSKILNNFIKLHKTTNFVKNRTIMDFNLFNCSNHMVNKLNQNITYFNDEGSTMKEKNINIKLFEGDFTKALTNINTLNKLPNNSQDLVILNPPWNKTSEFLKISYKKLKPGGFIVCIGSYTDFTKRNGNNEEYTFYDLQNNRNNRGFFHYINCFTVHDHYMNGKKMNTAGHFKGKNEWVWFIYEKYDETNTNKEKYKNTPTVINSKIGEEFEFLLKGNEYFVPQFKEESIFFDWSNKDGEAKRSDPVSKKYLKTENGKVCLNNVGLSNKNKLKIFKIDYSNTFENFVCVHLLNNEIQKFYKKGRDYNFEKSIMMIKLKYEKSFDLLVDFLGTKKTYILYSTTRAGDSLRMPNFRKPEEIEKLLKEKGLKND